MTTYLDFEKPIADLEGKIEELRRMSAQGEAISLEEEVSKLEHKAGLLLRDIYAKLTPWQKTQVARHPQRPYTLDYVSEIFTDWQELHGDRAFADDNSIVGDDYIFRTNSRRFCNCTVSTKVTPFSMYRHYISWLYEVVAIKQFPSCGMP